VALSNGGGGMILTNFNVKQVINVSIKCTCKHSFNFSMNIFKKKNNSIKCKKGKTNKQTNKQTKNKNQETKGPHRSTKSYISPFLKKDLRI
jgi:hypothetical protein